jgi:hypothetical protein
MMASPGDAGWYADPLDSAHFRYWDGERWQPFMSDGAATWFGSTEIHGLGPPLTYPAPRNVPLAPTAVGATAVAPVSAQALRAARREQTRARVSVALTCAIAAIVLGVIVSNMSAEDGAASMPPLIGDTATSTTADPAEERCVRGTLKSESQLWTIALAQGDEFRSGRLPKWDGDDSILEFADSLLALDLAGCPVEFRSAYFDYAIAFRDYGEWKREHSGVSNVLEGDDEGERLRLTSAIMRANEDVNEVLRLYASDLERSWTFTAG